jgi:hypothetical protein
VFIGNGKGREEIRQGIACPPLRRMLFGRLPDDLLARIIGQDVLRCSGTNMSPADLPGQVSLVEPP